ncbi:MAG: hypothetical protein R2705_02830 [Ilumatobacteraceae bacterium]
MKLTDVALDLAPAERSASLTAATPLGTSTWPRARSTDRPVLLVVFEPSATWQFSSIDPALAALDPLDFSGSLLVLASKDLPAGPGLPGIDERAVIEAGFTMRAALATAGPV